MNDALSVADLFSFDPITVPHGEDYVIEWEDEGMEEHIRFLLDKPDGWEHFESDALFLVENKEGVWNEYEGKKIRAH